MHHLPLCQNLFTTQASITFSFQLTEILPLVTQVTLRFRRTQPLDFNLATCFLGGKKTQTNKQKKNQLFFSSPPSVGFIYPLTILSSSAKLISFILLAF